MTRLRLSRDLSWHVRGDAIFSWHRRFGDVCEMSRDVAALCLAFDEPASVDDVCARRPGGVDPGDAVRFCAILRERGILTLENEPDPPLRDRRPYAPRFAVWERTGHDVIVYGRATSLRLEGAAPLLAAVDGTRTVADLDTLVPPSGWPALLRLCEADFAALKLLPPGRGLPPWAESTMPWPSAPLRDLVDGAPSRDPADLSHYHHTIGDADAQFDEIETTLSHLFRAPHRALGGETFGARLARALVERGCAPTPRVVEVGGGLGFVGRALTDALHPRSYLVVDRSPALAHAQRRRGLVSIVGDARALPVASASVDLLVSNEMAGDLPTEGGVNVGALALVDECARVLAPGGIAYVSEFGHPTEPPRRSDHLDHDEHSLRFEDLSARAAARGLIAETVALPALVGLDGAPPALVTTRASYAALRALFAAHGATLAKRAWLVDELHDEARRAGLDPDAIHGLVTAPVGVRTMGLVPGEFWALLARRPR